MSTTTQSAPNAAIHQYASLETAADPALDRVAVLTARLFGVPRVAIAVAARRPSDPPLLHGGERLRVKARVGDAPSANDAASEAALLSDVAAADGVTVVEDTAALSGPLPFRFCAGAPLVGNDGARLGALVITGDRPRALTERERDLLAELAQVAMDLVTMAALLRLREESPESGAREDRLASMGTLAAGVAHEINNPLTYVMANIGFVTERLVKVSRQMAADRAGQSPPPGQARGANSEERPPQAAAGERPDQAVTAQVASHLEGQIEELGTALAEAQEGAVRIRQIVRDLKVFAWGDQERYGPVDVRLAIELAVKIVAVEVGARARLVKDLGPVPHVEGSQSRLGQVFVNLLLNAAQAIKEGDPAGNEIRISTGTDTAGNVVIVVADTGAGIPPEVMRRIFDPFFTTKPLGIGTGLGLFICHGIIKALGGELAVDSELGRGSLFRVSLPPARRP